MMLRAATIALITLGSIMLGPSVWATDAPPLRNNPFARPPSAVTMTEVSPRRPDETGRPLELRATMVGPRDKLANVAGKTLRPGDEFEGYTLIEVYEDHAVFDRGGNRTTVYVKADLEEDDE